MKENDVYRVPPKLGDRFLLGGFPPSTLGLVMGTGFVAMILALNGAPVFIAIPAALLIFNWRPTAEKTVWQIIMLRFNYFNADNIYSLEECRKLWK
ncbi:MAG: hypothetical protein ACERKO_04300 [Acetanaerobacterium sp.]